MLNFKNYFLQKPQKKKEKNFKLVIEQKAVDNFNWALEEFLFLSEFKLCESVDEFIS